MEPGTINHFFRNQTVFITGGTGFLGKLMIEKLLRVNQIQKIFILVRAKRNKSSEERFQDLFDYPVSVVPVIPKLKICFQCFDNLKKERPDFKEKIVFVSGDCELSNLGMSQQSQEMLIDETDVVIHAAANVKFDQPLRLGANINVRSTKEVLALAKLMPRLKVWEKLRSPSVSLVLLLVSVLGSSICVYGVLQLSK
jgi:fatty acyl-CoA reductase